MPAREPLGVSSQPSSDAALQHEAMPSNGNEGCPRAVQAELLDDFLGKIVGTAALGRPVR